MKTLKNYGVTEMNTAEMKEVDGGFPLLLAVFLVFEAGLLIGYLITNNN